MSAAVRESSHVSRRTVTHGGPISGQSQSTATTNSLENNLDALLEDLQTSISRSATPSRGFRATSPQVEYRTAANSTKVISEGRAVSPTRTAHTTLEKYVSTGSSGMPSGIPGLEELDKELQDVQPGQSKTVAYKQVSYQYQKPVDVKTMDSWTMPDNLQNKNGTSLIDEIHESTYEESRSHRREHSPELGKRTVNRELLFSDNMAKTSSRQTSSLPGTRQKEVYLHETSYRTEPKTISTTLRSNQSTSQEITTNAELITPPPVPANLAPGPNTKVTTTVKTYTYELPGSPETYITGGSLPKSIDKTITYTLPGDSTTEKTVTYQVEKINDSSSDYKRAGSPVRYVTSSPSDLGKKSTLHKEAKYYREERGYRTASPLTYSPSPTLETKSSLSRNERYSDINGYGPRGPGEFPDHSEKTTIIYQNQSPRVNETCTTTTIDRMEEHYSNRSPITGRYTPTNYYTTAPPTNPNMQTSTTVYKYENTMSSMPPHKSPEDHQVLLAKPYPAGGVKVYPSSGTPINGDGPPKKLEDLMASFSDTEKEVLQDIERREKHITTKTTSMKKEVDFVDNADKSKKIVASPVYYPPGYELSRKEESSSVSQAGSGWQKSKAKYEYEASAKEKEKKRSGKAVVPVCLPLCCALPCVIM